MRGRRAFSGRGRRRMAAEQRRTREPVPVWGCGSGRVRTARVAAADRRAAAADAALGPGRRNRSETVTDLNVTPATRGDALFGRRQADGQGGGGRPARSGGGRRTRAGTADRSETLADLNVTPATRGAAHSGRRQADGQGCGGRSRLRGGRRAGSGRRTVLRRSRIRTLRLPIMRCRNCWRGGPGRGTAGGRAARSGVRLSGWLG